MPDSGNVDTALVTKLSGDPTLTGLAPDGVYIDMAPSGKTRFVIVSLVTEFDEDLFDEDVIEDALYLVKAVERSTSGSNTKAAAARIHELLNKQPLTVTGYDHMITKRTERVRFTEVDAVNQDERWQHQGGRYQVMVST